MNDLDPGRATQSRELQDNELDAVSGGIFREATYHPAKVTEPDIKLGIS
jgi:hypothetical protein